VAEAACGRLPLGSCTKFNAAGRARLPSGEQDHEDEDQLLINNRQNGRRRGRGGGGPRSPNQSPNPGNRQENRSRGNAAQLLEKYKSLARDAQMQGDRVQTEYWLQFADHYYRILNENRARFEEQRPRRDDYQDDDEGDEEQLQAADNDDGEDDGDSRGQDRYGRQDQPERQDRQERAERPYRAEADRPRREFRPERDQQGGREDRGNREPPREAREPRPVREPREAREQGRNGDARPERRPREQRRDEPAEGGERISLDVLPPAISVVEGDAPAKPVRRRTRRPRPEDGEEIAPAA
jgi:hypothetical protein